MPRARFHLAVSAGTRSLFASGAPEWLRVTLVDEKYPQLHEGILAGAVAGAAVPAWKRAIDSGIVILDAQDVLQAREAVIEGKPLVERLLALGGTGFRRNPHLRARIGTPIGELVRDHLDPAAATLIVGSALTGDAVEDPATRAVGRDASLLVALPAPGREKFAWARPGWEWDSHSRVFMAGMLPIRKAADAGVHGEHRPCITCNFCDRVCPAQILPHLLHRYVRRNIIDESLVRYRIFDCIDCQLCTYVCPSKIPVAQLMADGKRRLREEGLVPAAPVKEATRV
jgi:Na(+)-translocating NADH:ubiquinone oxidoreductase A subunit